MFTARVRAGCPSQVVCGFLAAEQVDEFGGARPATEGRRCTWNGAYAARRVGRQVHTKLRAAMTGRRSKARRLGASGQPKRLASNKIVACAGGQPVDAVQSGWASLSSRERPATAAQGGGEQAAQTTRAGQGACPAYTIRAQKRGAPPMQGQSGGASLALGAVCGGRSVWNVPTRATAKGAHGKAQGRRRRVR